jgi:type II secretory pathway pseudopilin PulG
MRLPVSSNRSLPLLLRFLNAQQRNPEQGLTIMECLVAIVLIGITIAMVTPPLLIATATRVQNRRAEQAVQLAQDEVDRISTLVQQGVHENRRLPAVATGANLSATPAPSQVFNQLKTSRQAGSACPAGSSFAGAPRYTNAQVPANQALAVDVDGDCTPDFYVQVFRTAGVTTNVENAKPIADTRRPATFVLGVRVYSELARNTLISGRLQTTPAQLALTGGQGKQATNPLAVVYRPMIWGEESDALCSSLDSRTLSELQTICPSQSP